MPFTANKASYKARPASWDPNATEYALFEDGQYRTTVSTKKQAKQFVSTSNKEDKRVKDALIGRRRSR